MTIKSVSFDDAAPYTVTVSNDSGVANSNIATLVVSSGVLQTTVLPAVSDMSLGESQTIDYVFTNVTDKEVGMAISGFSGVVSRDKSVPGDCTGNLAAKGSCTVRLKITPTRDGQISQMLSIGSYTTNYCMLPLASYVHSIKVNYATSTPVTYNFPKESKTDGKLIVTNHASRAISGLSFVPYNIGANIQPIEKADSCKVSLAAGASCSYNFSYSQDQAKSNESQGIQGINSLIMISYNQYSGAASLETSIQNIFPGYNHFLQLPHNSSKYRTLASNKVSCVFRQGNILYVGTKDRGISISYNNGKSWNSYTLAQGLMSNQVNNIYANGANIYVATPNGLSISHDHGTNWITDRKLEDGGFAGLKVKYVTGYGNKVYVLYDQSYTSGILVVSNDGGNSFQNIDFGVGNYVVYGVYAESEDRIYVVCNFDSFGQSYLMFSDDGGHSWSTPFVQYSNYLTLGKLYVCGSNIYTTNFGYSLDGGKSWKGYGQESGGSSVVNIAGSGTIIYVITYLPAITGNQLLISRDNGATWQSYTPKQLGLSGKNLSDLFVIGANVYVGGDSGLAVSEDDGQHWIASSSQNPLTGDQINDIYVTDDQEKGVDIYVATEKNGIMIGNESSGIWNSYFAETKANGIYAVGSNLYAATDAGLYFSKDGGNKWDLYIEGQGGVGEKPQKVYVIGNNIYVATNTGVSISRDNGASWQTYTTWQSPGGAGDIHFQDIYAVDSNVYAATQTGGISISKDNGNNWQSYNDKNGLASNGVYRVYALNNRIYAGTVNGLSVSHDAGDSWHTEYVLGNEYSDKSIRGLYVVTDNNIYLGTIGAGVIRGNGSNWQRYLINLNNQFPGNDNLSNWVNAIAGIGNKIYVGTNLGLFYSVMEDR